MGLRPEFARTSSFMELVYCWYEPYRKIGGIFILVWDTFSLALWSPVLVPLFKGEFFFPKNIFALFSFFMLIPAPTYWMLVHIMNKTKVHLSRSKITISNGPLPWLRKNHSFLLKDIKYILIFQHYDDRLLKGAWQIKADENCSVKAVLRNGESGFIFQNMGNPEEARIVRLRINVWLREMRARVE